jgi:Flp pilus assembly protein TadG
MRQLIRDSRGATAVEFALVLLPVLTFMFGIVQTCYIIWVDNLLHVAVDAAARCGATNSMTTPCAGNSTSDMISAADTVLAPLPVAHAAFTANTANCNGGLGLIGTYTVSIAYVVNLKLTAQSCYPTVPAP